MTYNTNQIGLDKFKIVGEFLDWFDGEEFESASERSIEAVKALGLELLTALKGDTRVDVLPGYLYPEFSKPMIELILSAWDNPLVRITYFFDMEGKLIRHIYTDKTCSGAESLNVNPQDDVEWILTRLEK